MPTNKQRREAAQRRLQRQLERRGELARRRRRNLLALAAAAAVLLVVGAVVLLTGVVGGDDTDDTAASTATSPAVATTVAGPCTYTSESAAGPDTVQVAAPEGDIATTGTLGLTLTTDVGPIGLDLDRAAAPCAAASFETLAQQGFFDGSPCHRQTASASLSVLQCGDPTGTGTGGPGYTFPTQVTGSETYPRGTVAMANSGSGTDGSQFFLVYADSQLPPDYTVVGTIGEAGLAVLDTIAARGIEGGAEDGAPAQPVTIESMTVA